ncbi:MAG: glycine betaine ABC transporter substrate-binding protein, partial [Polynucleobacter sp.]|nr:glycine betaine ABC transporter substrate-binding protein [Polynucleobacter sp.]
MAQPIESKVTVGSKRFTESYVLGELINLSLRDAGVQSMHRQGLGNTAIVLKALTTGQIDIYPEYTGTIMREILKRPEGSVSLDELNAMLAPMGLKVAIPLGFNNSYALAMKADRANALGLKKISDIAKLTPEQQAKLRIALSPEFKTRMDGWPALVKGYKLTIQPQKVLEQGLAYGALARGDVDIVDAATCDQLVQQ